MQVHDVAGVLIIDADTLADRRAQLRASIDHITNGQLAEHPLERVMGITELPDGSWMVETCLLYTSPSPRDGLERTFDARLRTHYQRDQIKALMRLSD